MTYTNNGDFLIKLFIKEKRIERNMTQKQLSKLSGVSESYIGDLERGEKEPTISVLCRIAKALKVKTEELYMYYDD